jgi:hypothetical protein
MKETGHLILETECCEKNTGQREKKIEQSVFFSELSEKETELSEKEK